MTDADGSGVFVTVDAVWDGRVFRGRTTFRADAERLHPVADEDVPVRAKRLDLGGTVFPRLTDHHTHLGLTDQRALFSGGITHAIDLGWIPAVATSWLADEPGRPAVAIAGCLITAPGGYPVNAGWGPAGSSAEVTGRREARETVRENVRLGASRIKVTLNAEAGPTLDDDLLRNIVAEARAQGVPVTAHVQGDGQTARAVRAGVDQLAHTPFTERVSDDLLAEAVRRGMSWVSTLDIHGWGEPTEQHRIASGNLARFAASGGHVLYGTDLGNGPLAVGVNGRELAGLVAAGLSADQLLRSIAGGRRRRGDGVPTIGPRVAWVPGAPPANVAALPGWLAGARGRTVGSLLSEAAPAPSDSAKGDR